MPPAIVKLVCEQCGKEFEVEKWRTKERNVRFCSLKCSSQWKRGKSFERHPSEIRKCAYCGKDFVVFISKYLSFVGAGANTAQRPVKMPIAKADLNLGEDI